MKCAHGISVRKPCIECKNENDNASVSNSRLIDGLNATPLERLKSYYEKRIAWLEGHYGFNGRFNSTHDMAADPSKMIAYGKYLMFRSSVFKINKMLKE